jgi:hypothetical protein
MDGVTTATLRHGITNLCAGEFPHQRELEGLKASDRAKGSEHGADPPFLRRSVVNYGGSEH